MAKKKKAKTKIMKGSFGPLFIWTQRDYNEMMSLLAQILAQLQDNQDLGTHILKQEKNVMSALDDLRAQVQENTDLEQSAVTLIQGIAQQLQDAINNNDSAALSSLAQQLDASAAALGAAVAANTPAVDEPPPEEPMSARRRK